MPSRAVSISELSPDVAARAKELARVDRDFIRAQDDLVDVLVEGMLPAKLGPNSPLRGKRPPRAKAVDREHPIQVELFAWADDAATLATHPELASLYAIPNEVGAGGKRNARQRQIDGARKKAAGRRKGMPDICLPVPRRERSSALTAAIGATVYGALYIEMKDETGTVRQAQRDRIALLRRVGNRCEVAMSADAAKAIIMQYLMLPKP